MLNLFNTSYNKGVIMALTIIVVVANQLAGQDIGLGPQAMQWISIIAGTGGTILAILTGNKNVVPLKPGQAVIDAAARSSGGQASGTIVATHKP